MTANRKRRSPRNPGTPARWLRQLDSFRGSVAGMMLGAILLAGCGAGSPPAETGAGPVVTRGRTVYQANCASCHGAQGEGQPGWKMPRADGAYLPPPHDSTGHTWHHSDQHLLDIIRRGGQAAYGGTGFTSGMPAWGDRLSEDEIAAVLAYIKTF